MNIQDPIAQLAESIWHARYGNRNVDDETTQQIWLCAVQFMQDDGYDEYLANHGFDSTAQTIALVPSRLHSLLGITHQDIADEAYSIYCDAGNSYSDNQSVTDGIWFEAEGILRRGKRE